MKDKKRKVRIKLVRDSYMILYINRKKYQKSFAGGFYTPDTTENDVKEWVNNNPKLELVNQ